MPKREQESHHAFLCRLVAQLRVAAGVNFLTWRLHDRQENGAVLTAQSPPSLGAGGCLGRGNLGAVSQVGPYAMANGRPAAAGHGPLGGGAGADAAASNNGPRPAASACV